MSGDGTEPAPELGTGSSNVVVVGSTGEDPMLVTVGTCVTETVVGWGLNSAESVGWFDFQTVEVQVVGVAFSIKLDKSSLGTLIFVGSGVLTGTMGVMLSAAEVSCL